MPDIGETLRETRMRRRIDMTEVEAATKIRAKYLRALENEEWDLLPGPTFVITFLRTYAEYLDLDARLLVEEYRQRFERPTTQDLTPFRGARAASAGAPASGRGGRSARSSSVVLGILILLGVLYSLGKWGPDDKPRRADAHAGRVGHGDRHRDARQEAKKPKKKAAPARVDPEADRDHARVYVCVVDATGKKLVGGDYLEAGQSTKTFRSQSFRLNLGNASVRMNVSGKKIHPGRHRRKPIGYEIKPGKKPKALEREGPHGALRHVRAGIVVTGTEVLSGLIADANGPWLSEQLRAHGVDLAYTVVVGDRPEDLRGALDFLRGCDLIITSGGLGPTADDLTAEVVAGWKGTTMELDPALEERIWAIVSRLRARVGGAEEPMRAGARKQAHVPVGATVLEPVGTAPGFLVGSEPLVCILPGPPRELQTMWAAAVATEPLATLLSGRALERRILRFFPLPEPQIAATLRELDADSLPLEITTCLRRGELEVATVYDADAQADYDAFEAELRARHGDVLFSADGATIDEVIAGLLAGRTIATAESCTGGLMAGRLTDRAGSSAYVLGGVVVYSNEAKVALAGVPEELIVAHGAVSPEVARALADGARSRYGADLGIGITGIAGPGGGQPEKPVGTVCIAHPQRRPTPRSAPSACPARAPTSATARPRSRCTCSARSCCAREPPALRRARPARRGPRRARRPRSRPGDLAARPARGPARHARLPRRPPGAGRRDDPPDRRGRGPARRPRWRSARSACSTAACSRSRSRATSTRCRDAIADALTIAGVYAPESRAFRPHITVARVRGRARAARMALELPPLAFHGAAVTLYASRLHARGRPIRGAGNRGAGRELTATLSFHGLPHGSQGRSPGAARAPGPPARRACGPELESVR